MNGSPRITETWQGEARTSAVIVALYAQDDGTPTLVLRPFTARDVRRVAGVSTMGERLSRAAKHLRREFFWTAYSSVPMRNQ